MLSSKALKDIVSEARPIIERQIDDAELIAGFREVVAAAGGDWGALKALIKAQIQDERDETGDGKRVQKILDKAEFATGYAELLGWSNMNEKNFSADEPYDRQTGELSPKLAHTIVTGMQTQAGRAALVAAVDIMIDREEAQERNTPETATQSTAARKDVPLATAEDGRHLVGNEEGQDKQEVASYRQAGTQAPRVDTKYPSDGGAISEVKGKARLENADGVEPPPSVPAFIAKTYLLRPDCQQRSNCRSGTTDHCHSCKVAMRERERADA